MLRRARVAEIVAFVGLVAAFVAALGPAGEARTTYSWPPAGMPDATPDTFWYTPLLLVTRIPERLSATIPCSLPAPLGETPSPVVVLKTARAAERVGGLAITHERTTLTVMIGSTVLARVPERVGELDRTTCEHRLELAARRWTLASGSTGRKRGGELERMPVVNGLFSGVDLRSAVRPSIEVTTQPHGVATRSRQALAWTLAAICALAALLLIAFERVPRDALGRLLGHLRDAKADARIADACMGALLLGWWILSPTFFDDGWTIARQTEFGSTGGFSQYYESFGVSLPLGYWLEWTQHWLTESTDALILLRIPALLCLAATWVVCRWILVRVLDATHRTAIWALWVAFAAMALAWGMTLRQEPTVALLVAAVTACLLRFIREPGVGPLAIAAVLIPLALTAHPTGIVALAPLIAVAPAGVRWARGNPASAVGLFTASGALVLALAFVGSDVEQRARDAQTLSTVSATVVDWGDELNRYDLLAITDPDGLIGYATPLRRAAVALMLLAALAFVARRQRSRNGLLDFPATSLLVALVLFITTPSKWPWHFGALIALVALAVAAETVRLRDELAEWPRSRIRSLAAIGVLLLAIAWAWSPRGAWTSVDLRTLDWTQGWERWLPVSTLAVVVPLALVGYGLVLARRRGGSPSDVPGLVAPWFAVLVAVPAIAFTAGTLIVDAAKTPGWTLTRQNLDALVGVSGCGLGSELNVPVPATARPLASYPPLRASSVPAWVPAPPAGDLPRFALGPVSDSSSFSPWFVLPPDGRFGLFVAGGLADSDRLVLGWGVTGPGGIKPGRTQVIRVSPAPELRSNVPWRFVPAPAVAPPGDATVVRIGLVNDTAPGAAVAVTAPFTYRSEPLERRLRGVGSSALVQPNTLPFFPCAQLPHLRAGVAEVPRTLITTKDTVSPVRYPSTSPFTGALDLFRLERLPLSASQDPRGSIVVFGLDRRIPGGEVAPPESATTVS